MDQEVHRDVSVRAVTEHMHKPCLYAAPVKAADYVKNTVL
jgi:hypothetical protein